VTPVSVVGLPGTVREGLEAVLSETGADDLMLTARSFDHPVRLRSFELAAGVL
jgi:hypothetical protein